MEWHVSFTITGMRSRDPEGLASHGRNAEPALSIFKSNPVNWQRSVHSKWRSSYDRVHVRVNLTEMTPFMGQTSACDVSNKINEEMVYIGLSASAKCKPRYGQDNTSNTDCLWAIEALKLCVANKTNCYIFFCDIYDMRSVKVPSYTSVTKSPNNPNLMKWSSFK